MFSYYLSASLLAMVVNTFLGMLWWGPLFGKKFTSALNIDMNNPETVKNMQKGMAVRYLITHIFSIGFALTTAFMLDMLPPMEPLTVFIFAVLFFIAYTLPNTAKSVLWENRPIVLLWIQSGYELITFTVLSVSIYYLHNYFIS